MNLPIDDIEKLKSKYVGFLNWQDIIAGLSIAGLLLPQALAYSSIGNLPAQAGIIGLFARAALLRYFWFQPLCPRFSHIVVSCRPGCSDPVSGRGQSRLPIDACLGPCRHDRPDFHYCRPDPHGEPSPISLQNRFCAASPSGWPSSLSSSS